MRDRNEVEGPPFHGVSALIAAEKGAALAAFDRGRFRTGMLLRLDVRRPRAGWAAPRLALAVGVAVLAAGWAVLGPGTSSSRRPIDERVIRRALQHAAIPYSIRPAATPGDPATARDARRRLERAPSGEEMERLICRALARQSRT